KNVEEATAWVTAETAARAGQATADLLLRERSTSAQYFQPVEFTRETVAADDGERVRLVLRASAAVDPGTLPHDGLWDAVARVRLGGWTKECRLGPAPRATRPEPDAGVTAGGRAVLPYWTEPQGHLALNTGVKGRRLGLDRVRRPDVSFSGARLRARLPLHARHGTPVRIRLTASGRTLHAEATAAAAAGATAAWLGAPRRAGRPRGPWRAPPRPAPAPAAPRVTPLPFALRARGGRTLVVPVPRPGAARRLAERARRVLGSVRGRVAPMIKGRR